MNKIGKQTYKSPVKCNFYLDKCYLRHRGSLMAAKRISSHMSTRCETRKEKETDVVKS